MTRLRLILAVVLSLVLATGSVTMALARVQGAAGTEMVICSGYGVVTVTLDADGNPTGPAHPCPDCLTGLGLALLPLTVVLPQPVARRLARPLMAVTDAASRPAPAAQARGPPTLI